MLESNLVYVLFLATFVIVLLNILMLEMDFMQPSILFNSTMLLSMFFTVLNVDKYGLYIGEYTFWVVILGMITFASGNFYIYFNFNNGTYKKCIRNDRCYTEIRNIYLKILIVSIMMLLFLYFNFKEVYEMSIALGNNDGISAMIKTVRFPLEREEVAFSRWNIYRDLISQIIAYTSIYYFFENMFFRKYKSYVFLIPASLYIPFTILSTGRLTILLFMVYCLVLFSIFYLRINRYTLRAKVRVLLCLVGSSAIFVLLFLFYGYFTGKGISSSRSVFAILSHYVGLSVPALDIYLGLPILEDSLIGGSTLNGIYGNLRTLGCDLPKVDVFLPFVKFNILDTNVYTAFRRYICDYGVIGMSCILFIFSLLFSFIYESIKNGRSKILLILYAGYAWTLIMSFHDEKFLMGIVNTSFIYRIVLTYFVIKFFEFGNLNKSKS